MKSPLIIVTSAASVIAVLGLITFLIYTDHDPAALISNLPSILIGFGTLYAVGQVKSQTNGTLTALSEKLAVALSLLDPRVAKAHGLTTQRKADDMSGNLVTDENGNLALGTSEAVLLPSGVDLAGNAPQVVEPDYHTGEAPIELTKADAEGVGPAEGETTTTDTSGQTDYSQPEYTD